MLPEKDKLKYLEDGGEGKFVFTGKNEATKKEKKELLEMDESYFEICGYHVIVNHDELR